MVTFIVYIDLDYKLADPSVFCRHGVSTSQEKVGIFGKLGLQSGITSGCTRIEKVKNCA